MNKINYTTVEEVLVSEGFLKWYQQTDEKEAQAWDEWIAESPEHQKLVNEVIQVLRFIRPEEESYIEEQEITEAINRLKNTIRNMKSNCGNR